MRSFSLDDAIRMLDGENNIGNNDSADTQENNSDYELKPNEEGDNRSPN